ncbi:MAG: TonB-dependent receptor plug domain-containing protein [Candidatus Kapaibacterium sp.]
MAYALHATANGNSVGIITRAHAAARQRDTARYESRGIRVEAVRPVVPSVLGHTKSAEMHDSDITRYQTRQSAELMRYMPGVFVRDYGGLAGIKTVSLRGAAAAQTAVYLDGVRLNASQNGLFDFSTLSSAFLRSVVVSDAVDATLSGAHAMGGIVMMTSRVATDSLWHGSCTADAGSWQERGLVAHTDAPLSATVRVYASADVRAAKGDYPFQFSNFGTASEYRRTNADYMSANGMLSVTARGTHVSATTRVIVRTSHRGAPDAVTQGNIGTSTARLDDESLLLIHNGSAGISENTELRWQGFGGFQTQQFADTSASLLGVPFTNRFISRDAGAALSVHHQTSAHDELALRVDVASGDLRGDLLRFGAGNRALRNSIGAGLGAQSRALQATDGISVFILGGVRIDANSDAAPFWTPRASVLIRCDNGLDISAHVARAFRLPSFNELYYQNYGSTRLTAEDALVLRATAEYTLPPSIAGGTTLSVTLFERHTNNQIVAVPRSPVTWSAMNVASVRTRGAELGAVSRLWSQLLLRAAVTVQDVRDRTHGARSMDKLLPYSPQTLGYAHLLYAAQGWSVGVGVHMCGRRYTQTDNAPASALAAYGTIQLLAGYEWKLGSNEVFLRAECDNAAQMAYEVVANYPMPGRMYRASVGWKW